MSEMEVAADPSRRVVLWGATGHSKSLRESLARSGYLVTALFDNNTDLAPPWSGVRLYHGLEGFRRWLSDHRDADQFLVAIGGSRGAQLAVVTSTCGAHTCVDRFDVLGWDGAAFVSLLSAPLEAPAATFNLVQLDQDPALEIVAQGGLIGSVGAGPQRAAKQVWEWNGAQYVKTTTELAPVEYRIHAIYEGDDAFQAGENDRAVDWYSRAVLDDSLKDWHAEIGYRTQNDRAVLTAYARYRLLLIGVRRGDANARDQLDALLAENPAGSPAFETARMAQIFWDRYQSTSSWNEACTAANAYANEKYQIFEDLNLFGYANRTYIPADLCPVE